MGVRQVENEEGKEKKDDFADLVQDILKLHKDCRFGLNSPDDKILKKVLLILRGGPFSESQIRDIRVELFLEYSKAMIKDLSKFAYDMVKNFAEVDKTFTLINKANMDISNLEKSSPAYSKEEVKKSIKIIEEIITEHNRLVNEGDELKNRGWKKFFKYLIATSSFVTIFYVALVSVAMSTSPVENIIFYWGILLILSYVTLKRLYIRFSIPLAIQDFIEDEE